MQPTLTTCKNCGNAFQGKYCNNCGQKIYAEKDKKITHLFEEGFHFITHFEGSFFTTLKTFFTRPGQLSLDYCNGIRKKYFKPISFFLLLVVFYLLFPIFEGLNMRLQYHMQSWVYGGYATAKVNALASHKGITVAEFGQLFQQKSEKVSKFLLVTIIPFSALLFWVATFRRRKYFYDQMVFSAEINSIYLLWGFLLLPVLFLLFEAVFHFFAGRYVQIGDSITGLLITLPLTIYTAIAGKRFYALKWRQSIILALFFYVVNILVVHYIYKFILFFISINSIR